MKISARGQQKQRDTQNIKLMKENLARIYVEKKECEYCKSLFLKEEINLFRYEPVALFGYYYYFICDKCLNKFIREKKDLVKYFIFNKYENPISGFIRRFKRLWRDEFFL